MPRPKSTLTPEQKKEHQKIAQAKWLAAHPGYYRKYRAQWQKDNGARYAEHVRKFRTTDKYKVMKIKRSIKGAQRVLVNTTARLAKLQAELCALQTQIKNNKEQSK